MSDDLTELKENWWGEDPQEALEPIYVPHEVIGDLSEYHPVSNSPGEYDVRTELDSDSDGDYAWINATGSHWPDLTRETMQKLKLRVKRDNSTGIYLEDESVDPSVPMTSTNWKVIGWKMSKTFNSQGDKIFLDEISWKNLDGRTTTTMWPWRDNY